MKTKEKRKTKGFIPKQCWKKGTSYFTSIKKKLDNLQNISLLCKKNYSQYMTKYDLLVGVTVKLLIQLIRTDEKYLILEWNSSHIQ